jgi:hypothetical protein
VYGRLQDQSTLLKCAEVSERLPCFDTGRGPIYAIYGLLSTRYCRTYPHPRANERRGSHPLHLSSHLEAILRLELIPRLIQYAEDCTSDHPLLGRCSGRYLPNGHNQYALSALTVMFHLPYQDAPSLSPSCIVS